MAHLSVKEGTIRQAMAINETIPEFSSPQPYTANYFTDRYRKKDHCILIAFVGNAPAGYMVSYDRDSDNSFYCWMAGVDPLHRRKGVMKQLMTHQLQWAKDKDYKKLTIKTRNCRREMLAFLVSNGFMFTETTPYEEIEQTRIHLEKLL
ncbi:MAG: GNAT family N-acetyltransferase [Candidatus Jacksonbacteria bacterium]|jgi:GNAT superfamily N-acetyltransferase|nr:GNAT family N-acetyltransferase [Candidatus Jacksonbacteria bacterium]MBT6034774.1 GNAT family N-acetyltransferase [Candidatus Jacksonbacteria bacterium]MBT6301212.1 GNAT family N-acetyltransferase [Candidatus Jacksonbacteria bacterium]MBT6757038.1 GNAT family N-acetyltransferase [Candidatus Jacksonbacteria bacterium]MBT6954815.1 GNAT family N-acetyltransferase [Candidatus Jacksonbacteria bacterium]